MTETSTKPLTICYFGIYAPTAPRDKVYLDGLREKGYTIVECTDTSPSFSKFFNLISKHKKIENYDVMMVGYLSGIVVPLAWLLARLRGKKIVFNALCSMYEASVLDRGQYSKWNPRAWFIWFLDFLTFRLASVSLVESHAQQKYISHSFFVAPKKLPVVYTSADEEVFYPLRFGERIVKNPTFTVVFRGLFLPATGVEYVLEAARILKNEDINFVLIGWGKMNKQVKNYIAQQSLDKVQWIHWFLPASQLREKILRAHVMLGQFSAHERLDRTIQNKTIEALALGMPYITRTSESNRELLVDGENCLFVDPANAEMIAERILLLKENLELSTQIGKNARAFYEQKLSKAVVTETIDSIIKDVS